ncbi:MAG: polysaccharide deacetylase family protein [Sulfurimonadaceae bacterium]
MWLFWLLVALPLFADNKRGDTAEPSGSAVVFMYHHFGQSRYPSTNIRLEQFESHLDYLEKNGYTVWPLSRIIRSLLGNKKIPSKTVALTMDDACISIYTEAYPRLKARKWPFTVFVNTSPVDNGSPNFMSWDQMRQMHASGAEFANHSLSHDLLLPRPDETQQMWQKRLKNEIEGAQKRLHEELGSGTNENPKLFSYPFGEYNTQTAELIRSMGYTCVSQTSGPIGRQSDLMALPRFPMAEAFGHLEGFSLKLQTLPLPVVSASPWEPLLTAENPPQLRLKLKRPVKEMGCYLASGEAVKLQWISETEAEIRAKAPLLAPRDRYTCTAPAEDGRWYWYSHLWIVK